MRIVRDACHGLDYAHRAGVVHRDVKPGNLLVRERDRHHQARRLRHREGRRADAHHPGRLGARHRRLPVARAGPRRRGGAGVGHLLARRLRLPVPDRPAAARVRLADRAGAQAAGGAGRAHHATTGPRCRRSSTRGARWPGARPDGPLRLARSRWPTRSRPALQRRGHRGHARLGADEDDRPRRSTSAPRRRRCSARPPRAGAHPGAPTAPRPPGGPRALRDEPEAGEARRGAPPLGNVLALLAALAAVAIVVVALLSSSSGTRASSRSTRATSSSRSTACATSSAKHSAS